GEPSNTWAVTYVAPRGPHAPARRAGIYKPRPPPSCTAPLPRVAPRLGALMERYQPQVVITYDAAGAYQHPDHVHAAQAAAAAAAGTGIPAKLYFTTMRFSDWQKV